MSTYELNRYSGMIEKDRFEHIAKVRVRLINPCERCNSSPNCFCLKRYENRELVAARAKLIYTLGQDRSSYNDCLFDLDGNKLPKTRSWCYSDAVRSSKNIYDFNNAVGYIINERIYFGAFKEIRIWKKL